MDLAFGRDGTLYVLEIDHDGLLGPGHEGAIFSGRPRGARGGSSCRRARCRTRAGSRSASDGLYVTTNATSPGGGQVVRIRVR